MKKKLELNTEIDAKNQSYYLFGLSAFFFGILFFTYFALFGARASTVSDIHDLMATAQRVNQQQIENDLGVRFEKARTLSLSHRVRFWSDVVLRESGYSAQFSLTAYPFIFTVVQLTQSQSVSDFLGRLRQGDQRMYRFHQESLEDLTGSLLRELKHRRLKGRELSQVPALSERGIPLSVAEPLVDLIPDTAVVSLIGKNEAHPAEIHFKDGFIFRDQQTLFLRHALPTGEVQTEEWMPYLKQHALEWSAFKLYQIKDSTSLRSLRKESM